MSGLSVVVITLNEAHDLPRCLASVRGLGEVVVVDSGSTDGQSGAVFRNRSGPKVFGWAR
jgi:glycosyltransferase involved in cell wall biosynthesis